MMIKLGSKGQGIVAAIFIVLIAAVVGIAITSLLGTEAGSSVNYLQSQQAFFIAEAGKAYVAGKLLTDAAYRATPTTVTQNFANGSFTVAVVKASSNYTLTSTATSGNAVRRITETLAVTSGSLSSAIHSDAASINFNGSSGTVNGNIEAKVQVKNYGSMTINGTISENITQINPALDFPTYQAIAAAQGQYYTSALTFSGGTYTGVYYTTKSATIGDNATINGSVFAEGQITFSNQATNVTITPASNYPALAAQSSISTSPSGPPASRIGLQNSTINGLIYSDSNIELNYLKNNVTINGTVISDNNIDFQNGSNFTINYTAGIFSPMPAGFTFSGGPITVIPQGDWNEVY